MARDDYNFTYSDVHIHLPADFPLEMIEWKVSHDPISELHHHDCFEIGICFDGYGLYILDGKVYTYQKGDIVAVGPNVYHRAHTESSDNDLWAFIFFRPENWSTASLSENVYLVIPQSDNPFLHDLVEQVYQEIKSMKLESNRIAGACMSVVVPILSRTAEYYGIKKNPELTDIDFRIQMAMNCLMEKENLNMSVKELADKCNISVSYLRDLFKRQVGMSPKEFQIEVRMKRAQSLIRCTNLRMVDIAFECGFNSISSFNRQFYDRYRITPYQMKKKGI